MGGKSSRGQTMGGDLSQRTAIAGGCWEKAVFLEPRSWGHLAKAGTMERRIVWVT